MHVSPSLEEFRALAAQGNCVPVYADFLADFETPVAAYAKLRGRGPSFLLESVEGGTNVGRYTFVGCAPRLTLRLWADRFEAVGRDGAVREAGPYAGDALGVLERFLGGVRPVKLPGLPRFTGGAVGFLGYEFIHQVEPKVPLAARDVHGLPLAVFIICDTVVIFDRAKQTVRLLANAHLTDGADPAAAHAAAVAELEALAAALAGGAPLPPAPLPPPEKIVAPAGNMGRADYEAAVVASKEYIRAGDIIQIVVSQRFDRPFAGDALDLYRALRTVNPSPYLFLFETAEFALVGASPEMLVRLQDGRAETHPIAGTRPRGVTEADDARLAAELLADPKERAEHLMLVDLARNDLGRVCRYGTVEVPRFMTVEHYSHVMHLVSRVEGVLAAGQSPFDLVRATFPAGTLSGAPKVRAMQIIAELERDQRGPYAGAMGYVGYDGNLDTAICLRTGLLKDGVLHIQTGAGLVADSVPATEYDETIWKASALLRAAALAEHLRAGA